ncbi:MAG: cupin domain-containing protein [Acidobacteriia bacterium]|nr:cupin domain-containing protein [Terriglobia bacterium]
MRTVFTLLIASAALVAADPAGVVQWKGAELKNYEKKLAPKIDAHKVATASLGNFGNHNFMVAHREGSGEAELHEKQADLFIVQTGEGTLIVGGTVVDPKTTEPNEIRGPSIKDGVTKHLGPGDVVHIPAKTPHQLMVDAGKQITYAVMKVNE